MFTRPKMQALEEEKDEIFITTSGKGGGGAPSLTESSLSTLMSWMLLLLTSPSDPKLVPCGLTRSKTRRANNHLLKEKSHRVVICPTRVGSNKNECDVLKARKYICIPVRPPTPCNKQQEVFMRHDVIITRMVS